MGSGVLQTRVLIEGSERPYSREHMISKNLDPSRAVRKICGTKVYKGFVGVCNFCMGLQCCKEIYSQMPQQAVRDITSLLSYGNPDSVPHKKTRTSLGQ